MRLLAALFGAVLIATVLWDAFETIIMPRSPQRTIRLTRLFYLYTWRPWSSIARKIRSPSARESFLSHYGPLSLILLLVVWADVLVLGFALVQWGTGTAVMGPDGTANFGTILYGSGVTFFTLGYGDVTPRDALGRAITVFEAGVGFGFLAIVIGYLPVVFQSFSQREIDISLLDQHAGSPPSAGELLQRHGRDNTVASLEQFFRDWERWSANVLESHLSYPTLCYWRSQHENQNWLAAITMILDSCALVLAGVDGVGQRQARLTFAMARHTVIDLTQFFVQPRYDDPIDRLPPEDLDHLRALLAEADLIVRTDSYADEKLQKLRAMYEPFVLALAEFLMFSLPPWCPPPDNNDNWQRTAFEEIGTLQTF